MIAESNFDQKGTPLNLDELVDEFRRNFGIALQPERVARVAAEVARGFSNVPITHYVPIFIRRLTRERLTQEIHSMREIREEQDS